jgi:hypothetical protein
MSYLVSNEVISVITFVEPTIKFSAVKSPSTTTSPVISKENLQILPLPLKQYYFFTISVILSTVAKEPV